MPIYFDKESEYHFTTYCAFRDEAVLILNGIPEILLGNLEQIREEFHLQIFGYVVMPTHLHLIWFIPADACILKVLKYFKGRTGKQVISHLRNYAYYDLSRITRPNGDRSLWKRKFYDFNLTSEKKFIEKMDYIHGNPVKGGLVNEPADWAYSSFRYLFGLPGSKFKVDRI
jgi:putative transposase